MEGISPYVGITGFVGGVCLKGEGVRDINYVSISYYLSICWRYFIVIMTGAADHAALRRC